MMTNRLRSGGFVYCGSLSKRLVREAQEKLEHYTHPDKYVFNYMPGGTRFMRNAPIPLDVRLACSLFSYSSAMNATTQYCPVS